MEFQTRFEGGADRQVDCVGSMREKGVQAIERFLAEVGRRSGIKSRASRLGLVEDLGQLNTRPAAMFYLVPTQYFKLFF